MFIKLCVCTVPLGIKKSAVFSFPASSQIATAGISRYCEIVLTLGERGDLPVDNNPIENSLRPFVVGRRSWLFASTPDGARASAVIYSLIETAKACGREPYAWLLYVLERLPLAKTVDDVEALLPWNVHDQDLAMNLVAQQ